MKSEESNISLDKKDGEQFYSADEILRILFEQERDAVKSLFRNIWMGVAFFVIAVVAALGETREVTLPLLTISLRREILLYLCALAICYFSARGFYHALAATYFGHKKEQLAIMLRFNDAAVQLMSAMSYVRILRETRKVVNSNWMGKCLLAMSKLLGLVAKWGWLVACIVTGLYLYFKCNLSVIELLPLVLGVFAVLTFEWVVLKGRVAFHSREEVESLFDLASVPPTFSPRKRDV